MMMHRCLYCGHTWTLYDPKTLLGGLRGILRLPVMAWHAWRCRRRAMRAAQQAVVQEIAAKPLPRR